MRNHYKAWTKLEDDKLKELVAAGFSPAACAEYLGRSKASIYERKRKFRIESKALENKLSEIERRADQEAEVARQEISKPKKKSFLDWLLGS